MRRIFFAITFLAVEAECRDAKPSLKSSNLIYDEPQRARRDSSLHKEWKESFATHGLLGSSKDSLSISSTWWHNGHSFSLVPHAVQRSGNGEPEDVGEEMDENIPYNRGLPGVAFSNLSGELDDRMDDLTIGNIWRKFMSHLSMLFIEGVLCMIMILIFAACYKSYKENPTCPPQDGEEHTAELLDRQNWRFGLCSCTSNPSVCCMTLCCPVIRWADTMEMSGLMVFWAAVTVCALLLSMSYATFGLTYLLFVLMATHGRQQLRELFGLSGRSAQGCMYDCFLYSCCCYCAIWQEAQQLEEAYAVGHPVVRVPDVVQLPPIDLEAPDPSKKDAFLLHSPSQGTSFRAAR